MPEAKNESSSAAKREAACVSERRAADLLVDILEEQGVDVVFGLPGGTIAPIFDALLDHPRIRVIITRHESSALFAAAGYARLTGRIGVALVTSGPGVINALTGLASAFCDSLPVLLIAGEVPRSHSGKGALQEGGPYHLNILGMARNVTKLAIEVPAPSAAPAALRRAIATALSGRQGPVALTLPIDVACGTSKPVEVALDVSSRFEVAPSALDQAARLLGASGRTAILAGSGVRGSEGPAALRALAERLQCPVMTTPKGKGVFPEDHPLSVGVFGLGGHSSAWAVLEPGIDVLLAVGTSLSELSTNGWSSALNPRRALIHVNVDAECIGRAYQTHLAFVAPAERVLRELVERVPQASPARFGVQYQDVESNLPPDPEGPPRIASSRVIEEVQRLVPPDSIFTCDSGEHFCSAIHYVRTTRADGFVVMCGLGSMGSGIAAALGVKLACPNRSVIAITGDGCFAMAGTEISVAVAERIPVLFLVLDDGRLGMVERGNEAIYGRTPFYPTGPMNIPQMASALGAKSMVIQRPGELLELGHHLRDLKEPLVVDVLVDRRFKLQAKGRNETLGKIASRREAKN